MSAATLEIHLPEPLNTFVTEKAEKGGYNSPAAFVEDLLETARKHEEYESGIDAKILEAVNSGHPGHLVTPEFWEDKHNRLQARLDQARQNAQ